MASFNYQHHLGDEWDCISPTLHVAVCYAPTDAIGPVCDPDCCIELLDAHLIKIAWPWGDELVDQTAGNRSATLGNEILERIEQEGCGYVLRQLAYDDWLAKQDAAEISRDLSNRI